MRIPQPDADIAGLGLARLRRGGARHRPRPGGEPRRRRHDAAHGRPGRRRTACRSSASTSARWATSPTSSRPARGAAIERFLAGERTRRGADAAHRRGAARRRDRSRSTSPSTKPCSRRRRWVTPSGWRWRWTTSSSPPTPPTGSSWPRPRVHRLRLLGPWPDRRPHPPSAAAHAGVAAHAVRPEPRARSRRPAAGRRAGAPRRHASAWTAATSASWPRATTSRAPPPSASARLVTFARAFLSILKAKFGLEDRRRARPMPCLWGVLA